MPQLSARNIALDMLCRVESGAYADHLLDLYRVRLNPVDRNLLQQLVQGTLTWRGRIDAVLAPYLGKPIEKQSARLRNLLRLGVFQLEYLDRVPAYAVVSESVAMARQALGPSIARLVNAVLRGVAENRKPAVFPDPARDPVRHLTITASHPEWLVRRWVARYGLEQAQCLCQANNVQPVLAIRPNALRIAPVALAEQLRSEGIEARPIEPDLLAVPAPGDLFRTRAFRAGLFSVQAPGAAWVTRLLAPQPGESLLDVCSAPGGKTTGAAEQMRDTGRILAVDVYPGRLKTVRENAQRLGLQSIRLLAADARRLSIRTQFDRVLVDAPCSALGILNHHPDARWRRTEADIVQMAALQRDLLAQAARAVVHGGVLVYSTCTLEPEENEAVVESFLAAYADFHLEPAGDHLPVAIGPYLYLTPHEHGWDGVFAARFRRA